jgi:chemotaxis protein CheX
MSDKTAENILKLPEAAGLSFADTLKRSCEQALLAGTGLTIDAGETQRIGTPCVQVLVSAALSFEKIGGGAFAVANPSVAFTETVSALGLTQFFKPAGT